MPTLQDKAKLIMNGNYLSNSGSVVKYSSTGVIFGLMAGFAYAILSNKNKFGYTLLFGTIGGVIGFGVSEFKNKIDAQKINTNTDE